MRENTGARVVFPTHNDEDKELIIIIGKKEGVEAAKEELSKAIKELVIILSNLGQSFRVVVFYICNVRIFQCFSPNCFRSCCCF